MNKFNASKIEVDGHVFDSRKEANRYCELKLLEKANEIKDLELQPEFELIPTYRENGKVIERSLKYRADFLYYDVKNKHRVVEDVKGYKKGAAYNIFVIKRKLMLDKFGIKVKEI